MLLRHADAPRIVIMAVLDQESWWLGQVGHGGNRVAGSFALLSLEELIDRTLAGLLVPALPLIAPVGLCG
jgi:hypothetical protein